MPSGPSSAPPHPLSLSALSAAYRERRLNPRSLVTDLQACTARLNGHYRVYIECLTPAQLEPYLLALEAASPEELPLYGVPFAIKDNIDLAAIATTAACPAARYLPDRSAPVVERLIRLGAIPLGKTNLDQFATGLNGLRSPYGACPNSRLDDYSSGGSSSGSALAVALDLVSFALGTDTAGSGRVPAALNGLVGCKPTQGLISTRGVVPCCPGLDCVSLFTRDADDAATLLAHCVEPDPDDPYSRHNPAWNAQPARGRPAPFRFGIPRQRDLEWLGCEESPALFAQASHHLAALGGSPVEIDFRPFLEAARLLYSPAGVALRHNSFGLWLDTPGAALPVIREVVSPGARVDAAARIHMEQRLRALKRDCDRVMAQVDLMLSPTIPRAYTRAELEAEPVLRNSHLGLYTNFMNLLDYAAVALPAGSLENGLPWGVTLFGRAFSDQYLLALARAFLRPQPTGHEPAAPAALRAPDRFRVVVCGAHLDGLALNHQLRCRGANLALRTTTAPRYRLYALPGGPPFRPALVRDASGGCIEVEIWDMPSVEAGSFLAGIGAPLGLGKVELADGSFESGFICEHGALAQALDITRFGGWRAYLAASARL